jgi:hypothetical protein
MADQEITTSDQEAFNLRNENNLCMPVTGGTYYRGSLRAEDLGSNPPTRSDLGATVSGFIEPGGKMVEIPREGAGLPPATKEAEAVAKRVCSPAMAPKP